MNWPDAATWCADGGADELAAGTAYCNECAAYRPFAMGENAQMICQVCGCSDLSLPACGELGCAGCGNICLLQRRTANNGT